MTNLSHRSSGGELPPTDTVQSLLDSMQDLIDAANVNITGLQAALAAGSASTPGTFNVMAYGAVGDGVTDDYAAIVRAVTAMGTGGATLLFQRGYNYKLSKAIILSGLTDVKVSGLGATITFPSSDATLTGTAAYDSIPANQRSAFYLKNCTSVAFRDIKFVGDSVQTDIGINIGCAVSVYTSACPLLRMDNCKQYYGAGLVSVLASSTGAVVENCYSYGSRGNSRLGTEGVFRNCTFELPTTASYDRVGSNGSSHAIYQYASAGSRVTVDECIFKNIRIDGAKMSGSNLAMRGFDVINCKFYNCGYNSDGTLSSGSCILFGADDVQTHTSVGIKGNQFFNCQSYVNVLGAKNVVIDANQGHCSSTPSTASVSLINVARYNSTSEPLEDVIITNNVLSSELTSGTTYAVRGINVESIGEGLTGRTSSIRVTNNFVGQGITDGIECVGCLNPTIKDNTVMSSTTSIKVVGARMPRITDNDLLDARTQNTQIKIDQTSWPIIDRNRGGGTLSNHLYHGQADCGNNAGGSTSLLFPLGGLIGRVVPAGSTSEVVFAYGYGWTAGDTFTVNSTVLTYGTDFTSFATLVSRLNGGTSFTSFVAADFGVPWSITTNHIRLRRSTTSGTQKQFSITATTANKTACVILSNNTGGQPELCYSRGEGIDKLVIWSPVVGISRMPTLRAENADAATCLALKPPYVVSIDEIGESGSCVILRIDGMDAAITSGTLTPLFQWQL